MTLQRGAPIARRGSFAPATRATVPLRPTMRSVRFPRRGWVFFSRREAARCPHFASASFSANKIRYGTGIPRGNSRVGEFGTAGRPQLRCLGAPEPHACPALRAAHPFARRSAALPAAIDALGARSPLPARLPQGSRRSQSRGPEASARLLEAEVTRGGTGGLSLGGGSGRLKGLGVRGGDGVGLGPAVAMATLRPGLGQGLRVRLGLGDGSFSHRAVGGSFPFV